MQLHLHVLHSKQEMYHLKRCLIGLKAWVLDQDWCEQAMPPLRVIELLAVHTFINASPEDKVNTDALLTLCLRRIANWDALDMVRNGVLNGYGGPHRQFDWRILTTLSFMYLTKCDQSNWDKPTSTHDLDKVSSTSSGFPVALPCIIDPCDKDIDLAQPCVVTPTTVYWLKQFAQLSLPPPKPKTPEGTAMNEKGQRVIAPKVKKFR
jgi:hypothetical protein